MPKFNAHRHGMLMWGEIAPRWHAIHRCDVGQDAGRCYDGVHDAKTPEPQYPAGNPRLERLMGVLMKLDKIDVKILAELQKNGRITNVELAERVNLSPSPCLMRVKKLQAEGFITGY